jgi:hypothetical protein
VEYPLSVRLLRRFSHGGAGKAGGILRAWLLWEALNRPRSRPIGPGGIVRYRLGRHHGPAVRLQDGITVQRGDRLLELHMDNLVLLELARRNDFDSFVALLRGVADLHLLARMLANGTIGDPVKALHGLTPYAYVLRREGFELHSIRPTFGASLTRMYMAGLLALYHPRGWEAVSPERARRFPGEIWMSTDRFLARMGVTG